MTPYCDAHVHIVDDVARRPIAPGQPYTPAPAPLDTLRPLAAHQGVERLVLVQPSFYGTDNAVLLESLAVLQGQGRGVVVLDPSKVISDDLPALTAAGVRGLRLNLYSPGAGALAGSLVERFAGATAVAARAGWHVEVLAPLPVLTAAADLILSSAVPVVVDHFGLPGGAATESPEGRRWLDIARRDHVWVKLSAPYRMGPDPLAIAPNRAWLRAILDVAGDRCLWGSDWPHTPVHDAQPGNAGAALYRPLDYGALLAGFRAALPSPAMAEQILGANPARLY